MRDATAGLHDSSYLMLRRNLNILQIPTGEIKAVAGTTFDLTKAVNVGDAIAKHGVVCVNSPL